MKTKLFTLLLAVAASVGTMFAWDYEHVQIGDLYYNLDATGQIAEVTSQNSSYPYWSTTITTANIPASVEYNSVTYSVTSIGERAFSGCSSLTSMTIPNSVTSIGRDAFFACSGLTSVAIPNSVTSIGDEAFSGCSSLTSIEIPNSVTSIGSDAFFYCTGLTSPVYNTHVFAYMPTSYSGAYTIPDGIESIAGGAFSGCSSLASVTIPNSVTSIGIWAFEGCSGLTSITCEATTPPSLKSIVFYGVEKSIPLYVPAQSVDLYKAADQWKDFNVQAISGTEPCITASGTCGAEGANLTWELSCDGVLTISGTGEMYDYKSSSDVPWASQRKSITSLIINTGVTSIGGLAFFACSGLTSVEIPNSVTSLGVHAFYQCTGLTSVTIGNGITSIGDYAFCECTSLTFVTIGNSVASIGYGAFSDCTSLTSVTIPNSVTSIGASAFSGCSSLTSINIPNSVTSIGDYAFYGCSGLSSVTIPNSVTSIGNSAFYGCTGLTSPVYNSHVFALLPTSYSGAYTILDGIESIAGSACSGCAGLTFVTIPNTVTSIGDYAFANCSSLTSVDIPSSVTSIGQLVFYGCSNLTSPVYNAHVFAYMPTSYSGAYTILDDIKSIAGGAFYGCTGLTSIEIPNSVTSIGDNAFRECTSLTSMTIGSSVTSIGASAFSHCSSLTSVEIPYGVTSIDNVFYRCSSLTKLICLAPTPPVTDDDIFEDCPLKSIYVINAELYTSGWSGYYYSKFLQELSLPYELARYNYTNGYASTSVISREGEVQMAAVPDPGYRFVKWADGNTENPRTIDYSQRTIEPVFEIVLSDKCGKDNVLTWTLDTTTMALNITGKGALSENYTYGRFIESLTIGNEITQIGVEAFAGREKLKDVIIGSSIKVLEKEAFRGCSAIETITCYSQRPPTVKDNALNHIDYNAIVYVPADYLETYKMHDIWGMYDVRPIGAAPTEATDVKVTPTENTATITWPAVESAYTYELVIKDKSGNVICTLVFNAQGQLTQIIFGAPAHGKSPQQTQTAGFSFTVTGLEEGTSYDLTITAKDENDNELDKKNVSFHTEGAQGIEDIHMDAPQATKILLDGKIYILRGEHVYDTAGKMVR